MELIEKFEGRYSGLTDYDAFLSAISEPLRKSIRTNTLKARVEDLKGRLEGEWALEQVPWCPDGFWIAHKAGKRTDIGNIPEHNSGQFYIQEAASMIPVVVLCPQPREKILDMCASPGGKTTQIAQCMENIGEILATDFRDDRIAILKRNIERMGVKNCTVLKSSGQQLKDMKFDRVLADVPCSGTGNLRVESIPDWDPEAPKRIAGEQRSLLHSAYCLLKKGGLLVYSTCSVDPEENEAVVDFLLKRHKKTELEEIDLPLKRGEPILEYGEDSYDERISRCLRLWPQDNKTSGFFVAKIRKLKK